ncbi:hypothetical protein [Teredinibacter sp. KSP-S5-2]|uniref:hypothetical protein n=1 Tax=Teredinibacter sp. KSP-S5-2 TaxID=3034506 RepID=UPI0029345F51|nr:hypothetical protein [Teredinibacter sp. KSP-S5-2]WNO07979.1 hypothetical protein P5V12_13425 [Teredinibacter sp. KSP-S5-2]
MKNTSFSVKLLAFSVLMVVSALSMAYCPNPSPGNGPELIQYCENYADQRASRSNYSTWNYYFNYCIDKYGPCVGGGTGSSSGGSSSGGTGSSSSGGSGDPAQCTQYANSFCGTNQQSACWIERYNICMGN